MSVSKHYLNKEKTKFNWRVVVYIPTGEYDRFGKPIKTHHHVGYYPTKSEGEVAERKFWNDFEAGTLELNKDAKFEDVILYFLDFAKNEGKYAKGTICNYEGYLNNHFQMLKYVPVKNPIFLFSFEILPSKSLSPIQFSFNQAKSSSVIIPSFEVVSPLFLPISSLQPSAREYNRSHSGY